MEDDALVMRDAWCEVSGERRIGHGGSVKLQPINIAVPYKCDYCAWRSL
jgi:hypothetical protein